MHQPISPDNGEGEPLAATLTGLFERQVAARPNAEAVRYGGKGIGFAELQCEALAIAGRLASLGIGRGNIVGIALPRSPTLVAAVLGVLRTGAAYLPLDPEYPVSRIAYIVADAAVPVILTTSQLAGQFAASGAQLVLLDRENDSLALPSSTPAPEPEDLVYVLYTSGSTGTPKAVGVTHANVVNLIAWGRAFLGDGDMAGILFSTSLNFDLSAFELFLPLCMGGRLIVVSNLFALPRSPDSAEVRLVNSVPSLIDALLRTSSLPAGVNTVIVAGERLTHTVANRVFAVNPAVRLLNCYGPTETTVYSTCAVVDPDACGDPPIGQALANTALYVLDQGGAAVPVGEIGELYIGGAGVARGYIRRPDLDRERFLPDLSGSGRMYRTGDLVRWLPDGQLEFIGRVDDQIKINGLRVEPGEIEAVLEAVPGIVEAVVVLARADSGPGRLIGYLVAEAGQRPELPEIRACAAQHLPHHMRPAQYLWLDQLPLTPNGKIDRQALPPPAGADFQRTDRQPETQIERVLAEIWEDVLGRPPAGVAAAFLESGGDSLAFLNLVAAIEAKLGICLPLDNLFDSVLDDGITIAALATAVMMTEGEGGENLFLTVWQSYGEKPPLFLFPGIGGDSLQMRLLAKAMGQDRPLLIFHRRPGDDPGNSVEQLAARCIALMQQRQPAGPYHLAGYSFGGSMAYEMARQLKASGHDVAQLVIIDTMCPAWRISARSLLPAVLRWTVKAVQLVRHGGGTGAGSLRRRAQRAQAFIRRKLAGAPRGIGAIIDPSTISPELAALVQTHLQLIVDYRRALRCHPPARIPVALVSTGTRSRHTRNAGPTMGWECVSDGAPTVRTITGNHDSIVRAPDVTMLAAAMRAFSIAAPQDSAPRRSRGAPRCSARPSAPVPTSTADARDIRPAPARRSRWPRCGSSGARPDPA